MSEAGIIINEFVFVSRAKLECTASGISGVYFNDDGKEWVAWWREGG